MSIKGTTQELYVKKNGVSIITFIGNRISIPYSEMERIEYSLAESNTIGKIKFYKRDNRYVDFKFKSVSNDLILKTVDFVTKNVSELPISEMEHDIDEIYPEKQKGALGVKIIGILLIIVGVIGIAMGTIMYGDIGIACMVGAVSALLSGVGFILIEKRL